MPGPQRMNPYDFGALLTFPLVPPAQGVNSSYEISQYLPDGLAQNLLSHRFTHTHTHTHTHSVTRSINKLIKSNAPVYCAQMMNPNDFGHLLTFPLAPP